MMPILQARESLARVTEVALGNGTMKKADSRKALRDLRRAASPRGRREVQKPKTRAEHHAMLASVGIRAVPA